MEKEYKPVRVVNLYKWQQELWEFCNQKLSENIPENFKKENIAYYEQGLSRLFTFTSFLIFQMNTDSDINPCISFEIKENDTIDIDSITLKYDHIEYLLDNMIDLILIFGFISVKANSKGVKLRDPLERKLFIRANKIYKSKIDVKNFTLSMALKEANEMNGVFGKPYFELYFEKILSNFKNFRQK